VDHLITNANNESLMDSLLSEVFEDLKLLLLELMLNDQTKSLYLDNLGPLEDCPSFFAQVLAKAPNLEMLALSYNNQCYEKAEGFAKTSILNSIKDLKNLTHLDLRMYMSLDNDDLILVTSNLKNLVSLKVI